MHSDEQAYDIPLSEESELRRDEASTEDLQRVQMSVHVHLNHSGPRLPIPNLKTPYQQGWKRSVFGSSNTNKATQQPAKQQEPTAVAQGQGGRGFGLILGE